MSCVLQLIIRLAPNGRAQRHGPGLNCKVKNYLCNLQGDSRRSGNLPAVNGWL